MDKMKCSRTDSDCSSVLSGFNVWIKLKDRFPLNKSGHIRNIRLRHQ